jgi:hypothetical protein
VRRVACPECGCNYSYTFTRKARGYGSSAFYLDNAGGAERANTNAKRAIAKKLEDGAEPAPCPKCLCIPPELTHEPTPLGQALRTAGYWLVALAALAVVITISRFASRIVPPSIEIASTIRAAAPLVLPAVPLIALGFILKPTMYGKSKREALLAKYQVQELPTRRPSASRLAANSPPPGPFDPAMRDTQSHLPASGKPAIQPATLATITVICQCGKKSTVDAKFAGKRARCKICGTILKIPGG